MTNENMGASRKNIANAAIEIKFRILAQLDILRRMVEESASSLCKIGISLMHYYTMVNLDGSA